MKKNKYFFVILSCGILALAANFFPHAFSLATDPANNVSFSIGGADYYLRGSFNSWATSDTYKFSNRTLSNVNLTKGDEIKVWDSSDNWHGTFTHRWTESVSYSNTNYVVPVSGSYTFTLTISNGSVSVHATAEKQYLYLTPNNNWTTDNARFAAYFFGTGGTDWKNLTSNGDGTYRVDYPNLNNYQSVIFCRMNPGSSINNWDNKWNQTADLTIPAQNSVNCMFNIPAGAWDGSSTGWTSK